MRLPNMKEISPSALVDLWGPVWAWFEWLYTYREYLDGAPSEKEFGLQLLAIISRYEDKDAFRTVSFTPGVRAIVTRTWDLVIVPDLVLPDDFEFLEDLCDFLGRCDGSRTFPTHGAEFLGAGGDLASLVLLALRTILDASPNSCGLAEALRAGFLRSLVFAGTLDDEAQKRVDVKSFYRTRLPSSTVVSELEQSLLAGDELAATSPFYNSPAYTDWRDFVDERLEVLRFFNSDAYMSSKSAYGNMERYAIRRTTEFDSVLCVERWFIAPRNVKLGIGRRVAAGNALRCYRRISKIQIPSPCVSDRSCALSCTTAISLPNTPSICGSSPGCTKIPDRSSTPCSTLPKAIPPSQFSR
ncbi:hypothetical protein FB451DRAFT_1557473 [Mycena latifolia]|nr:hypothetical protein FB451DRAFT_1557473 [Mycena latifolia]